MEILLDKRCRPAKSDCPRKTRSRKATSRQLREDILEAFTEEQVEEIERRLDTGDFFGSF